jgi:hypothetical protein
VLSRGWYTDSTPRGCRQIPGASAPMPPAPRLAKHQEPCRDRPLPARAAEQRVQGGLDLHCLAPSPDKLLDRQRRHVAARLADRHSDVTSRRDTPARKARNAGRITATHESNKSRTMLLRQEPAKRLAAGNLTAASTPAPVDRTGRTPGFHSNQRLMVTIGIEPHADSYLTARVSRLPCSARSHC